MEMKKPTLYKREFQDHRVTGIYPELSSPDLAWALAGEGTATEKIDGPAVRSSTAASTIGTMQRRTKRA